MKIRKVEINGFRSIKNKEISFKCNGHKVLVGKNESGKSNILKALNLLSGKIPFENKDKKFLYSSKAFVRFSFDLEEDEINKCKKKFNEKIKVNQKTKLTQDLSIEKFFEKYSKNILYWIDCNAEPTWGYWGLDKDLQINGNWYVVGDNIANYGLAEQFPKQSYINEEFLAKNLEQTEETQKEEIIQNCLTQTNIEEIYIALREIIEEVVAPDDYTFPVINWQYSAQEHDLPSYVKREVFAQDPDSCIPLKNMFLLSGIQEDAIQEKISKTYKEGTNYMKTLFDSINRKTNKYLKNSWKEFSKVKMELRSDGANIAIGIQDSENTFDFRQRSDGFRRFISFLLLMSVEMNKRTGKNSLILIDEPETGLHPSSAKDLRNKLIELGKDNIVVYATHSISMIDTENIENNLIVTKKRQNTNIEKAKEDGTSPAENVYRAIGYSIYEDLKKTNILLEGYTDKQTFDLFMMGNEWKKFGKCYTGGVKNIKNICPILDLADRKYFILSDADKVALQHKKEMGNPSYWFIYKDLGSDAITIEDFYEQEFFFGIVKKVFEDNKISIERFDLEKETDRINYIRNFLNNTSNSNPIIKNIKDLCIKDIKKTNIKKEKIMGVLDALLEKITSS